MFAEPRWIRASCSFVIPRVPSIRGFAEVIGARLVAHYFPLFQVDVEESLEPELPRIVLPSRHGNSQIHISQVSLNLQVAFTPDWQIAPRKGEQYLHERLLLLRTIIQDLPSGEPKFTGVSFEIHVPSDAADRAVLDALASRAGLAQAGSPMLDLEIKRTNVLETRFFSNVVMRNFRAYPQVAPSPEAQPMPLGKCVERGVAISIDFNDRYAFNEQPGYRSSAADAKAVLDGGLAAAREAATLFVSPR